MSNSSLRYSVADLARIFGVDRDTIKTMAYKFSEYLNSDANPPKGEVRVFHLEDIRVISYVCTEWEEDPDIESIKIGLNHNNHFENPNIDDIITSLIPLFIEPPENIAESWKHGVIIAGLASLADMLTLARSYKLAGDLLIDIALENEEAWDLHNPALFNYRHSIELFLKVITNSYKLKHDLLPLYSKLKKLLKEQFNSKPPEWFEGVIMKFNEFDPGGTAFRYGGKQAKGEVFVDFLQMKKLMGWLVESFQNILRRQGITY